MIAVSADEMRIIRKILKARVPDCDVLAFGSRVKGTNGKNSDLDIAVSGGGKLEYGVIGGLRNDFMESDLSFRVDVLDYNAVSESFRKIIDAGNEKVFDGKD